MKVLELLKENKTGAIIGGVYGLLLSIDVYYKITDGVIFVILGGILFHTVVGILSSFLAKIITGPFFVLPVYILGFVLTIPVFVILGAYIQNLIKLKSWNNLSKLIICLIVVFSLMIFFNLVILSRGY